MQSILVFVLEAVLCYVDSLQAPIYSLIGVILVTFPISLHSSKLESGSHGNLVFKVHGSLLSQLCRDFVRT